MHAFLAPQLLSTPRRPSCGRKANASCPARVKAVLKPGFARRANQPNRPQGDGTAVKKRRSFWKTKSPLRAFILLSAHLLTGAVVVSLFEGWTFLEGLYFAVAVATTVGYGDLTPTGPAARLFVAFYALASAGIIGQLLARVVDAAANAAAVRPRGGHPDEVVASLTAAENSAARRATVTACMLFAACLFGGILYGRVLQSMTGIDIFYFVSVTASTVGLGDLHPISGTGRSFATVWLVIASLGFANLVARFAEWRGLRAQRVATENVLKGKFSEEVFRSMDKDGDGRLDEGEFLGYILCKMGKATPEEVSMFAFFARFWTDG